MSRADRIFIENMTDIMENGFWDTELDVRPRWEDGTPAHNGKEIRDRQSVRPSGGTAHSYHSPHRSNLY